MNTAGPAAHAPTARLLPALAVASVALFGCASAEAEASRSPDSQNIVTRVPAHAEPADEHTDYALRAEHEFAWAKATPAAIYLNDVMPADFLDEAQRPWRAEMYRRFAPIARTCATRREAILKIAAACEKTCGVAYSTKRRRANQCVAESLETRTASCTGLSILLAAAYRSVGIPARIAGVAEWGDRPGNHTWVEVWDEDGWHFVEYYPDAKGLDHGWILEPVAALDPENPNSRVIARTRSGGDSVFTLPWNPERRDLRGVDRTADYLKLAGGAKDRADGSSGVVVFEARTGDGERVARRFTVYDGDKAVAEGITPGKTDDLNNAPRRTLHTDREYTVRLESVSGKEPVVKVRPKSGEVTPVTLRAE